MQFKSEMKFKKRMLVRVGTAVAVGALATVGVSAAASAHVTVSSPNAEQGGWSTIYFKVPNESDTASTVKLTVAFPTATPIAFVSYQPVPGWTATITKAKLATPIDIEGESVNEGTTAVTWVAASGAGIAPGQFQQFPLSVGPLPKAESMSFTATQTYSDGKVVKWNQPTPASGEEPELPAPTLQLTSATEGGHGSADMSASQSSTTSSSTNAWSIAALVVAVIALIIGIVALVRGRSRSDG